MPFSFRSLGLDAQPDKIAPEALRTLMLHARNVEPESAEFGNTLATDAGEYLSSWSLSRLIRDEMSNEAAAVEIKEHKKIFRRIASLLPAISALFSPDNPDNVLGFTSAVWDCCEEYQASLKSERKDKKERHAIKQLSASSEILRQVIDTIRSVERIGLVSLDYTHNHELIFDRQTAYLVGPNRIKSRKLYDPSLDQLAREIDVLRATIDIAKAKASRYPEQLHISGNNGKASIVKNAHWISLMWNGPQVSTTPGSDFSYLCSLLFECASGKTDESLAGTVARYARSKSRYKTDEDERIFRQEEALDDNFSEQRNAINRAREQISEYDYLLSASELDDLAHRVVSERIALANYRIQTAEGAYGPNQVQLSDFTTAQLEEFGIDKIELKPLWKADIAIGNLRREIKAKQKLIDAFQRKSARNGSTPTAKAK